MARFLSIVSIFAIGVGFLSGLVATTPDMQLTAREYYNDTNTFDLYFKAGLGITEEDLEAVRNLDFVKNASPAYVTDLTMENNSSSCVVRIYGMDLDDPELVNNFVLTEGRLPENAGECLICTPNAYAGAHSIGEKYTISAENQNYDERGDTYAFDSLTVVGKIDLPYYLSIESEPSTVGTGSVNVIMYVPAEAYTLEVYTDIYLTIDGLDKLDCFSDAYENEVEKYSEKLETLGLERCQLRYDELYSDAKSELDDARAELDDGWKEYEDAKADADKELSDARAELDDARAQIDDNRAQIEAARASMPEAMFNAAMGAALAELDAAEADLNEGERDYEKAKADADKELSDALAELEDAEAELADAQKELDDLEVPEWYIFSRDDTMSFTSFKSNSEKIAAIAKVFPLFLFFVAALVALTTMTRLVEEERIQIGTLKALGYSDASILGYYVGYSIIACITGSVIGSAAGFQVLPIVVINAYRMMFVLPNILTPMRPGYSAVIISAALICCIAATLAACLSQLREKPSTLMLPRVPKAGKRIFLERISFIWKRLKFTHKVTARNIFRYKKRFYMTVLGIAGCSGLLLCAFGIRDSIQDIVKLQYDEINNYNFTLYMKESGIQDTDPVLREALSSPLLEDTLCLHSESGHVEFDDESMSATIALPKDTGSLKDFVTLRERKTGEEIPFDDNSVVITEKLCETLGISVGDRVILRDADGRSAEVTVTGICENYVMGYVYIGHDAFADAFGIEPEYAQLLGRMSDQSADARDELSTELLISDNVLAISFSQTIRESFENTVQSIDYIVIVLIIAAGTLAIIVLYNLTNINICERKKEMATLKVLGFHEREVASYIYRETNILCLIGIALGLLLGIWLHHFVILTAEIDSVMFGRSVYAMSFVYATAVTIFFMALVDLIMLKKLRGIDMVESMKANE